MQNTPEARRSTIRLRGVVIGSFQTELRPLIATAALPTHTIAFYP
jgi:hypothetical protein